MRYIDTPRDERLWGGMAERPRAGGNSSTDYHRRGVNAIGGLNELVPEKWMECRRRRDGHDGVVPEVMSVIGIWVGVEVRGRVYGGRHVRLAY